MCNEPCSCTLAGIGVCTVQENKSLISRPHHFNYGVGRCQNTVVMGHLSYASQAQSKFVTYLAAAIFLFAHPLAVFSTSW